MEKSLLTPLIVLQRTNAKHIHVLITIDFYQMYVPYNFRTNSGGNASIVSTLCVFLDLTVFESTSFFVVLSQK